MTSSLRPVSLLLSAATCWGQGARPSLVGGVVTYTAEDGTRREISVGKPCADLWVAPDESVVAFIGIERSRAGSGPEPFIEESSIFVGRKADGFRPVRLPVSVELHGRLWKLAREPKVSADRSTVFFFVPESMTSWALIRTPLGVDKPMVVAYGDEYCLVWGGARSGDVAILSRAGPVDPTGGISYPCYVRSASGQMTKLADECFVQFDRLADKWAREHGGVCH